MNEIITLKEFRKRYGQCSRFFVYGLIKNGMPFIRPAGKYLFDVAEVEQWMKDNTPKRMINNYGIRKANDKEVTTTL